MKPSLMPSFPIRRLLAAAVALCSASAAEKVDFGRDVLPILSANCFACHGRDSETREARLRLDVRESATTARAGFTPIVPGRAAASELIARITSTAEDEIMPPPDKGRKLHAAEIRVLRDWIDQGAEYAEHWAFVPPVRPALPSIAAAPAGWPQSPVDHFILQRLASEKLRPAGPASRTTLIRRAALDLTGLAPTPAEIEAFVADRSPDAYARLIDRLLASPHYGERYGRHWLDVARYADSGGFETDLFFGHAWRYRDYVIRSFNADKPFNRFIQEQIAGDELFPGDPEARLATGLYTTGPVLQEAGMVKGKLEYDQHTDFADTTGAAFLGLTVGCARCHDHKYDPVSQKEYFALQAVFAASDQFDFSVDGTKLRDRAALKNTQKEFEAEQARTRAQRETDPVRLAELLRKTGDAYIEADAALKARVDNSRRHDTIQRAVARFHRGAQSADSSDALDEEDGDDNNLIALKAQLRGLVAGAPADKAEAALLNVGVVALLNPIQTPRVQRRPVAAPADATATTARPDATLGGRRAFNALTTDDEKRNFLVELGRLQIDRAPPDGYIADLAALRHELGRKNLEAPSSIPIRVLAHRETPLEIQLLHRGELDHPRDIVPPGLPEKFAPPAAIAAVAEAAPNRRRAALAGWIASDQNLLTARVIANRVWQWHFGEGLVRTPNDFGIRGDRPTHPELLDWLATELVEHGWSLKHLHRVIMRSSAYQMAATADAATLTRDPDNRLLTRFQPHRLQAEIIWDGIRAAAGTLDLTMFGLPIAPPLDEQEQLGNYRKWPASTPAESNRRAIYLLVKRSFRFPMLSAFDLPDNITSCGRRDITTIPNQALTLLNNRTMREQAAAFATRLLRGTNNSLDAVPARAWPLVYSRPISAEELASASAFLRARAADPQTAVADLCLALFNTNEFIYQQ